MPANLFSGWHLIIVLFIILLLFGAPKLPGLAKSLGESMRILRKEVRSDEAPVAASAPAQPAAEVPVAPTAPAQPVVTEAPEQGMAVGVATQQPAQPSSDMRNSES